MNQNQFDILCKHASEKWFCHGQYPISYKLVILHSLYKSLNSENEIGQILHRAWEHINAKPLKSFSSEYFSLYRFYDHEGVPGIVLVDHQHGCFPLLFYDYKDVPKNIHIHKKELRLEALAKCLFDIHKKHKELFELLKSHSTWTEELQNAILEIIPEPNKSKKSKHNK